MTLKFNSMQPAVLTFPQCMFSQQKKSIHIPFRSKYNRVTKRARYLHENPSCLLCNILHRYLQQADYSVIEEATMVSAKPINRIFSFASVLQSSQTLSCVVK